MPESEVDSAPSAETMINKPTSAVMTCYLPGVSTRQMRKLVKQLRVTRLSKVAGRRDGEGPGRAVETL